VSGDRLGTLTRSGAFEQVRLLSDDPLNAAAVCRWLWINAVGPLVDALDTADSELIVVPTGYLHLLPLHAAGTRIHGWIDDRVKMRILPSAALLVASEGEPAR
jgi:hypothetical protein